MKKEFANCPVLLTGGAGFIGSHTAVEVMKAGYEVVIADDLSNSERSVIERIGKITGRMPAFYEIDVKDRGAVERLFDEQRIGAVIHFAGYKAVGESVKKPLENEIKQPEVSKNQIQKDMQNGNDIVQSYAEQTGWVVMDKPEETLDEKFINARLVAHKHEQNVSKIKKSTLKKRRAEYA